jgi:1-acyl-sn-glycerol-3-phosphate acyltransferase
VEGAESAGARWGRRAVTIPACLLLAAASFSLLPLLLAGALAVDLVRGGRLGLARLVSFGAVYLLAEVAGLAACFALWLVYAVGRGGDRARFEAWNFRLQCLWTRALLAAIRRIFALRFELEGAAAAAGGPLLVFARHASLADVLLPAVLVADRQRLRLRWVLKRELLVDPCLDVVGARLPNVFVDRSAAQSEREIAAVADLAAELGPGDGVLIYPEGARSTAAVRERALARLAAGGSAERLERLRGLRHLLPPRAGGSLALLAAAPRADVLVLGHLGFEGLARVKDLLSGSLVGRTVKVRFWRHAAAAVPREREAALAWLDERWLELDRWVDAGLRAQGAS